MKTSETDVLICFDDHFAPAASVMLTSLFLNNENVKFNLYAIAKDVAEKNLEAISRLCDQFSRTVNFLEIDKKEYEFFEISEHLSHATYFRLFAPEKIRADRILYFDVDLIIQTNISPLLEMDLKNHAVAGALDNNPSNGFRERIGLELDEPYINTGVLLINAKLWRTQRLTRSLITFYAEHKNRLRWGDQDLLNAALAGKKVVLDQQWNIMYGDLINGKFELPDFDRDSFQGVFHFNTSEKPWRKWSIQPYRALYQKYADRAPIRMAESSMPKNLDQVLKKMKQVMLRGKRRIKSLALGRINN